MVQFVGKYNYESGENFDEFLKALGVGWILRNLAKTTKPTIEVTLDGDVYTVKTVTTMKTTEIKFKVTTNTTTTMFSYHSFIHFSWAKNLKRLVWMAKLSRFVLLHFLLHFEIISKFFYYF